MASKFPLVVFCLFISLVAYSQSYEITVQSNENDEPLIGVSILSNDVGFITDEHGRFTIKPEKFPITISLSYVGYQPLQVRFKNAAEIPKVIRMKESPTALDVVTVTGSKYEQNILKSTVSIDIIKSDLVSSINSSSSDEVLNKIPGVQVLDGQANIRGGSGYSYGAGSRVMLLIDDIPALQPDAGFPNWSDIPIENLSQIEVVKGAASALYGSAALNGIINFRSAYAKSTPETKISTSGTAYLSPKDKDKKWWGDTLRYETNLSFVHKQKFGKLDMIASGFVNKLESFNQATYNNRVRGNLRLRYRFTDRLSAQLGTLYNGGNNSSFFLWKDGKSGAYQPFDGTESIRKARRIYIDPSVTYYDTFGNKHKLMARTFLIENDNSSNQSNSSVNHYAEYQFQRNFESIGLMITSGINGQWSKVDSEILGDTTFTGQNHALYLQADKTLWKDLTISAGLRYEYINQKSPEIFFKDTIPGGSVSDDQLIARIAANYQVAEYSSIRASYGQGYRYPTLTERFVTTTFGIFSIFANPHLRPEHGWSSEIGYKQGFALGGFKGFLDVSGFISEYQDMIEFTFLGLPNLGFKPLNIGDTRIEGYEVSIAGELNLGSVPVTIMGGYTFINPYYKNFNESDLIKESISEYENATNILKYRSKHQIKMDAEATISKFKWGISFQYASHFINIDRAFEEPFYLIPIPLENPDIFGVKGFRNTHNKGYKLVDTRISYNSDPWKITLLVNNIFNVEYNLRPALLEAPRNVGIRVDYTLN